MSKVKSVMMNMGMALASLALFVGSTSVNMACTRWVYQPKVPASMMQHKKHIG